MNRLIAPGMLFLLTACLSPPSDIVGNADVADVEESPRHRDVNTVQRAAQNVVTHDLKVGTHSRLALSKNDVASVVGDLNDIMTTAAGECLKVGFKLTRGPDVLPASMPRYVGDGNFEKFKASPYSINIVSQILECGGFTNPRGQSFAGCTAVGSFPVTAIASVAQLRSNLWAHELGHSQGLLDRCDDRQNRCKDNIGWVMAGVLDQTNTRISDDECLAFQGKQNFPILIGTETKSEDERSVVSLLESSWNHAMPVTQILEIGSAGRSDVVAYIESKEPFGLANAVLALGLIGTPGDVETLLSVMTYEDVNASGSLDFGVVDAKLNVPVALGYLANLNGSPDITRIVGQFISPKTNLRYFPYIDDIETLEEYAKALARNAGVAAAIAGDEVGAKILSDQELSQSRGAFDLGVDEGYSERIGRFSEEVQSKGLISILEDSN